MYATHRHRRERGAHAHARGGGGGGGGGAKKQRGTSPVLFCFVAAAVLLGNSCHALFPQKKGSSHGFNWRMLLTPRPQGVKYELHTLPVDAKAVTDGDTITVHVVMDDHPGSFSVPQEVQRAAADRAEALMAKNYQRADELQKIILDAGQVTDSTGGQVLTKKYQIRLRGIDAPETSMPYGRKAKEELTMLVQGKRLKISVYGNDRYNRLVGDVDCNGVFVQEHMLKKGLAWHYIAYDQQPELARWENQAKASQMGLWSLPNPDKPWEWRKEKRIRNSRQGKISRGFQLIYSAIF